MVARRITTSHPQFNGQYIINGPKPSISLQPKTQTTCHHNISMGRNASSKARATVRPNAERLTTGDRSGSSLLSACLASAGREKTKHSGLPRPTAQFIIYEQGLMNSSLPPNQRSLPPFGVSASCVEAHDEP